MILGSSRRIQLNNGYSVRFLIVNILEVQAFDHMTEICLVSDDLGHTATWWKVKWTATHNEVMLFPSTCFIFKVSSKAPQLLVCFAHEITHCFQSSNIFYKVILIL